MCPLLMELFAEVSARDDEQRVCNGRQRCVDLHLKFIEV